MERLLGETDQEYIARQTRLKEEARARMAAKFGNGSGGSRQMMGGVGSSSTMQGIGSNPNYTPGSGYGGSGGVVDLDGAMSSVTSAFSTGLSMVSSVVNDESTRASVSQLGSTASAYGGSFWNSLKSTVNDVALAVTQPEDAGEDGLAALQREFESHKPAQSKYSGFGSDSLNSTMQNKNNMSGAGGGGGGGGFSSTAVPSSSSVVVGEAPGLPHEDRNGVERLTGETDEQYVVRQTRLRDEAKARMAAKFGGGGGLSSAGPTTTTSTSGMAMSMSSNSSPAPVSAPAPTMMTMTMTNNTNNNVSSQQQSRPTPAGMKLPTPARKLSSDDFFSDFGT